MVNKYDLSLYYSEIVNALAEDCKDKIDKKAVKLFLANFDRVKNTHKGASGIYYAEVKETADDILKIIETISPCDGLAIECVGRFLWTKGKQKPHEKVLKSLGFTYQENKRKWCLSYKGYVRKNKGSYSMAWIRQRYAMPQDD